VFDDLVMRYCEAHRFYHNLAHVQHVLSSLALLPMQDSERDTCFYSAWFHDAVYDPRRTDNEERSAHLARDQMLKMRKHSRKIEAVVRVILATKEHVASDSIVVATFLDADLSLFGSCAEDYDAYSAGIRMEYAFVDEDDYRMGRARVLRGFLDRPTVFQTDRGRLLWEQAARANLNRELGRLAA
jgi:predicted metal-dependent HD superfamily phosphohydrolase